MANPHLTGGCGCGAVKFEIDEPLVGAAYCHCTRCQRRTGGAASASALMKPGSLRIVQGEAKIKAWTPEDGWAKHFCGECGSALFGGRTEDEHRIVRMGVIDGDPGVRPIARQFVANAAPWEPVPDDGLHRFDESMPVPDN
ncbi:MAG: GFA family protein [Solirubrobacteraceae bacterium]|jgi:hypothetical protein